MGPPWRLVSLGGPRAGQDELAEDPAGVIGPTLRAARSSGAAAITDPFDFDRNGVVNALDLSLARANRSRRLASLTPPPAPAPLPPAAPRKRSEDDSIADAVLGTV